MDMVVILHDNHVYGLTKKQASPTSPIGFKSNTTPRGSYLEALNPLTVTLGVQNVSFVAQAVDWVPELLFDIINAAYHHNGFSFIRIIQRCPEFLPKVFEPWLADPGKTLILTHENGLTLSPETSRTYKNQLAHDPPTSTARARSPPARTPSRWASSTATPMSPATRTCAMRGDAHHGADPRGARCRARPLHRLAARRTGAAGRMMDVRASSASATR